MKFLEKAKVKEQRIDQWLPGIGGGSGDWLQTEEETQLREVFSSWVGGMVAHC